MKKIEIRPGSQNDADLLRRVFEYASQGISPYLWRNSCPSEQDIDGFINARMQSKITDPDQTFLIAEIDGQPAGGILTYPITVSQPVEGQTPMMRSFIEADNAMLGSICVNAIAVFPEFRRLGVAAALLQSANDRSARNGLPLSLSVSDANPAAISTYEKCGFQHLGRIRMEKENWDGAGDYWILMINETARRWDRSSEARKRVVQSMQSA